jgi:hypothetical protein
MKLIFASVAITVISTGALAQRGVEDLVKGKPVALGESEPLLPERCEFVGVRQGVKLWRGDCVSASSYERVTVRKKSGGKVDRSMKR